MAKNETDTLKSLADSLDDVNTAGAIFREVANVLEIKWQGETPKSLRKDIAKAISPDRTKDADLKHERTRVLAHINRAMDIAKSDGTVTRALQDQETLKTTHIVEDGEEFLYKHTSTPRRKKTFTERKVKSATDPDINLSRSDRFFRFLNACFEMFNITMNTIEDLFSYVVQNTILLFTLLALLVLILISLL